MDKVEELGADGTEKLEMIDNAEEGTLAETGNTEEDDTADTMNEDMTGADNTVGAMAEADGTLDVDGDNNKDDDAGNSI